MERVCFLGRTRPERLDEYRTRRGEVWPQLTSSTRVKRGDSSRSSRGLRCWFAVHRRATLRKKAPRAATACPAAVPPASGLAIAADSLDGTAAHRQTSAG
jgi:hypothetical protein